MLQGPESADDYHRSDKHDDYNGRHYNNLRKFDHLYDDRFFHYQYRVLHDKHCLFNDKHGVFHNHDPANHHDYEPW